MFDFANLLFSGPCSARCTFCIGRQIAPGLKPNNLNTYPPRNLEVFLALIRQHGIRQVVFSGSDTDPQLYRNEERLLDKVREELPSGVQISLHTNGLQALRKMVVFNQYDRAAISLPTFEPGTYRRMMGRSHPPDLKAILESAAIPVKVSCVVTPDNVNEIPAFASRCTELGVHRLVLRKLFAETKAWVELLPSFLADARLSQKGCYRNNPVYVFENMEVTLWDFNQTHSRSINLFSSGLISDRYLLHEASTSEEPIKVRPAGGIPSNQDCPSTRVNSRAIVSM